MDAGAKQCRGITQESHNGFLAVARRSMMMNISEVKEHVMEFRVETL
jgi:hypothetical protein